MALNPHNTYIFREKSDVLNVYPNANRLNIGSSITPLRRVSVFSDKEWEEFTEEWLDLKKDEYVKIERLGGAGDQGRDVIAYKTSIPKDEPLNYTWDCYQCKHYANPLTPAKIYVEIGKILYYTFEEQYPIPDAYYFVAPKGCGTKLSKFLKDPELFKKQVIENWEVYCQNSIISEEVELDKDLLKFVQKFDFTIFDQIHPKTLIEEHKPHTNHNLRFGGGLPDRERLSVSELPSEEEEVHARYVEELFEAYNLETDENIDSIATLKSTSFYDHFSKSRIAFHHAEQLRNFSRDNLPLRTYEDFQEEIHLGISNIVARTDITPYQKITTTENQACTIVINSNPLKDYSFVHDKLGICHQLVNEEKISWH